MNDNLFELKKQAEEAALKVLDISFNIDKIKQSSEDDVIKNRAIEALEEQLSDARRVAFELEDAYNAKLNNRGLKAVNNAKREQLIRETNVRAEQLRSTAGRKKLSLIYQYIQANPNSEIAGLVDAGVDLNEIYDEFSKEIQNDIMTRKTDSTISQVNSDVVVGNESVPEPTVVVPETVIPEPVNEEEVVEENANSDSNVQEENQTEEQPIQEQVNPVQNNENVVEPAVGTSELVNEEKMQIPDMFKGKVDTESSVDTVLQEDFYKLADEQTLQEKLSESQSASEQEKSNDEVKSAADAVREDASEEHKELTNKSQKNLKDFKGFFANLVPEGRKKVKSIAIGGTVVLGAVGLAAAAVTHTLIPAAIVGLSTYLYKQIKQGQQASQR